MAISYKFIVLAAALLLTAALAAVVDKYKVVGPELLNNADFEQGLDGWQVEGILSAVALEDGVLHLELQETGNNVHVKQTILGAGNSGFVRLEGELRGRELVSGPKHWHRARLDFSRYGVDGKWLPLPQNVVSLEDNMDWRHYQAVFRLLEGVGRTEVIAQLPRTTGELWVKNLSLHKVVPAVSYRIVRAFLFLMWAAGLVLLFRSYVRGNEQRFLGALIGLVVALIVAGTMLPASYKTLWQGGLKEMVLNSSGAGSGMLRDSDRTDQIYLADAVEIGKIGHFVFFGLLVFLMLKTGKPALAILVLAEVAVLGAATELMQFFVEGRSPLALDFLTDMAGAGIGVLFFWGMMRNREKLRPFPGWK